MDETRFVLSDLVWERLAPLRPGNETDPGGSAPDRRGVICQRSSAIGTVSFAGSGDGPSAVFLRVFSTL
ncbi:hypothetical protein JI58_00975 [Marinosulfonomonas sp. PRT-SC04]|nr:hypothetical protein JI58_00975 [Marinosulfonomonas sp. PRT-SC04]